ncbi:MATE family efflux transporter [Jeotgalibacillus haloalkalitolerans]|uniref:Multidrug export protein MepA n=1 Tax=Jeotgalibacillus haloalkalitolerans TaxID=3104292 RepID=A0ABU5KIP0_9BACL|nr:MATE family efflux transporter [Jeotgalibacillus sp. HH7-29]MDZ5711117.1 MATE family efflux transporter [Jeotgalibacillus sp. HH7-29]
MKQQSERLGQEKIPSLMVRFSVPAFIGMFVMAFYNIADTFFIARGIGTVGVAALSIAFPLQLIITAFAAAIGIGGASIISRRLGENRLDEANKIFGNVIWLVGFLSVLMVVAALAFLEPILITFGATEEILPYAAEYLSIILYGAIFQAFAMSMNNVVRSEGNAKMAMLTMVISAGLNIVLDPIFIFTLDMGMAGAAIATVISQAVGAIWLYLYFRAGKSSLEFRWIGLLPDWRVVREITQIGSATFVRQTAGSLMFIAVNWMLVIYGGESAVAIFGIINRIMMFAIMPMFGIVQGMQPIIGFNYGAKLHHRVSETLKLGIGVSTVMAIFVWVVTMLFPGAMMSVFSTDPEVISGGEEAMRFIFLIVPIIGFQMVTGGLYQALGKAKISFILSMARQLIFLIPLVLILPSFLGLTGVWLAFPIADGLAFLLSLFFVWRDRHKLFQKTPAAKLRQAEAHS